MNRVDEKIAERVKKLRSEKRMTQTELAEKCEISMTMLQQIEYKTRTASTETISKLAAGLNVSPAALVADFPSIPQDILDALAQCDDLEFEMVRAILAGRGKLQPKKSHTA